MGGVTRKPQNGWPLSGRGQTPPTYTETMETPDPETTEERSRPLSACSGGFYRDGGRVATRRTRMTCVTK